MSAPLTQDDAAAAAGRTPADALVAVCGLSLLFLLLVFVIRVGAQVTTVTNVNTNLHNQNYNMGRRANSVLRGRVTYADTGQPVRRARVLIYGELASTPTYAATNRAGEFAFKNVAAGRYFALVESPGIISPLMYAEEMGQNNQSPFKTLDERRSRNDFVEVTLNGTGDAFIEIHARRGGVITGKVAYEDGSPVAEANIVVFRRRDGAWKQVAVGMGAKPFSVTADARGVYRVSGLPAGDYAVSAFEPSVSADDNDQGEEDAYLDTSLAVNFHADSPSLSGATPVRVLAGEEVTGVDILFPERPMRTLSGRVSTRRDDRPIPGAIVRLEPKDDALAAAGFQPGLTRWSDDDGSWSIKGVPDGLYRLSVSRYSDEGDYEERRNGQDTGEEQPSHYYVASEMVIKVEGDMQGIALKMAEAGSIAGKLVVEGRKKLPDEANVLLVPTSASAPSNAASASGSAAAAAISAPSAPSRLVTREMLDELVDDDGLDGYGTYYEAETGEFQLWRVPAGSIYISIMLPPDSVHYVKSMVWKGVDLMREPLRLKEGDEIKDVQVTLGTGAGAVAGRVLLKAGGEETAGDAAQVFLVPVDALRRRIVGATRMMDTSEDGRYLLSGAPGEYFVLALRREDGKPPVLTESYLKEHAAEIPRVTLKLKVEESLDLVLSAAQQ